MRPPYRDDRYGQRQADVLPNGTLPYQGMGRCELREAHAHPGHVPLMKSAARSAMASTVRLRFARTVSGMIDASMMRSPSTP